MTRLRKTWIVAMYTNKLRKGLVRRDDQSRDFFCVQLIYYVHRKILQENFDIFLTNIYIYTVCEYLLILVNIY